MHKKGFTLAEVLITLSIIGVVAALTIPSVTKSYEKSQNIAGYKKAYSTLNQMASMLKAEYGSIEAACVGKTTDTFLADWTKYVKYTKLCDSTARSGGNWFGTCWHANGNWYNLRGDVFTYWNPNGNRGVVMSDGSIILLGLGRPNCDGNNFLAPDGTPMSCAGIQIDINGMKGPNRLGRDIFEFNLTKRGVIPYRNASTAFFINHCNAGPAGQTGEESGRNCGYEIMMNNYDWEK